MSNYDNQELRYSCLSEPMQGSPYHPPSLTLSQQETKGLFGGYGEKELWHS